MNISLMKPEIRQKLSRFLDDKLKKIYDETRDDKPKLDLSYIKTKKGYENSVVRHNNWGDGYEFSNSNGYQCYFYFKGGKRRIKLIRIKIDDISSSGWYGTIGMLYCCMDEIGGIAVEMRKLKDDLEKQEKELEKKKKDLEKMKKINEIAKNSIITWLKSHMQNQPYSYYTTESAHKITLSIKLKNSMQLDIPIYYSRFQKIMLELPETIQQFVNTVNNSKIKVLVRNSNPKQQWITLD